MTTKKSTLQSLNTPVPPLAELLTSRTFEDISIGYMVPPGESQPRFAFTRGADIAPAVGHAIVDSWDMHRKGSPKSVKDFMKLTGETEAWWVIAKLPPVFVQQLLSAITQLTWHYLTPADEKQSVSFSFDCIVYGAPEGEMKSKVILRTFIRNAKSKVLDEQEFTSLADLREWVKATFVKRDGLSHIEHIVEILTFYIEESEQIKKMAELIVASSRRIQELQPFMKDPDAVCEQINQELGVF